jgi:hypothetical protein
VRHAQFVQAPSAGHELVHVVVEASRAAQAKLSYDSELVQHCEKIFKKHLREGTKQHG